MSIPARTVTFALALVSLLPAAVIPPDTVKTDVFAPRNEKVADFIDPLDPLLRMQVLFTFDGLEDFDYEIQSSDRLKLWEKIDVKTAREGSVLYQEFFMPLFNVRFYRAAPDWTLDAVAPTWPALAALVADNIGAHFVDLDWPGANDNTGIVAYALYRDGVHVATIDPALRDWAVTGLDSNTNYEFDLVAIDAGGNCTQLPSSLAIRTRVEQEPVLNAARNRSVYLSSGEFTLSRTDMAIAGRELGFVFTRTYRSDFEKSGPLGYGWTANVFERLRERNSGDVVWLQGIGRSDTFTKQPDGSYLAPPGIFKTLLKDGGGFRLISENGSIRQFSPAGKIQTITTRKGNTLTYNRTVGQLTSITDDMGRETTLTYDSNDRIEAITDFTGREVRYTYDAQGNLVTARSPVVTGTPNGNDFPAGKTERYVFDAAHPDPDLAHNLVQVIAPNEVADASLTPSLVLTYGSSGPLHDRLLTETRGGTNASGIPAGGTTTYTYATLASGTIAQTTVTDPRGHEVQYAFGPTGHLRFMTEILAGQPDPVTAYTYDAEGNRLSLTHPEGNVTSHTYDSVHPSRRSQGNRLGTTRDPGPRGGEQPQLVTTFTYEPIYNQIHTTTDPRGETWTNVFDFEEDCDFAAIGAKVGLDTTDAQNQLNAAGLCIGLPGDFNNDGVVNEVKGNVIVRRHPTIALDPTSNQAALEGDVVQEVVELFRYNQFGQPVFHRDPEFNVHLSNYHPETDPNGDGIIDNPTGDPSTGGYLASSMRDAQSDPFRNSGTNPPPAAITTRYTYNPRGVAVTVVDPRGVATGQVVNDLDQTVQVLRASATGLIAPDPLEPIPLNPFSFVSELHYDANNNLVRRDVEDRGDTSNTGGVITTTYEYDILDHLLVTTEEIDAGTTRETRFRYDPNGNLAVTVQPEGNAVSHQYDERDLVIATTGGAVAPPPEALVAGSPGYNPRGGVPSTVAFSYDGNRNRDRIEDAADTDGSAANNGPSGGDLTTFIFDGYDRVVRAVDPTGNAIDYSYDANGNVLKSSQFGPDGGPTPGIHTPSGNLLAETGYHYDALNRLVQKDAVLFSNTVPGADLKEGATSLGKGDLVPGDGAVNTRYEYDALGRLTFTVEDDGDVSGRLYDGAGRPLIVTDPVGNTIEYAYDDLGNVIETRETDVATVAGVADEIILTTYFYDSLGRVITTTDNLGHTARFEYDSRENLLATSDANGPVSGSTLTRRAFPNGPGTVNAINTSGNVTTYTYDGLDRLVRTDRILTASGLGDGTLHPIADSTQGGGDGHITSTVAYDLNSLVKVRGDDNEFQTAYHYDNLNRLIAADHGICAAAPPTGYVCDPSTTVVFDYDPDHNVIKKTDEVGSVVIYTYDALDRVVAVEVTRGPNVGGTKRQDYEYDGLNRLTRSFDDNGDAANDAVETVHDYDSLSRPVREILTADPTSTAGTTAHAWRAANLRSGLEFPDGRALEFAYDSRDRVTAIFPGGSGSGLPIAGFDYIGTERPLVVSYPRNGTRHTFLDNSGTNVIGYDGIRRQVGVRDLTATNAVITGFQHTYDRLGNRLTELKLHDAANSENYTYDSAYRLVDVNRPAPAAVPMLPSTWQIDGNNNWLQVDSNSRQHSSFNEIKGISSGPILLSILSDENGNVTDDGLGLTYQWDAFNRLVRVQNGGTLIARYFYDAAGRRVRKENSNLSAALNGTTEYFYDGHHVIEERTGGGSTRRQYVHGPGIDNILLMDVPATGRSLYYHKNTLGSIFALTDATSGAIAEQILYSAYGQPQITALLGGGGFTLNPFLFTGRRFDSATGNFYYRARYLDPVLGRFLGRDPLGPWGDLANAGNAYAYCNNNPVNCTDPTGRVARDPQIDEFIACGELGSTFPSMDASPDEFLNNDPRYPIVQGYLDVSGDSWVSPLDALQVRSPSANSLVINLSVAFQSNRALEYASCHGALVIAATASGPMYPAGWEAVSGVTIWDYERMSTADWRQGAGIHDIHMHQGLFSHSDEQRNFRDGMSHPQGFTEVSGLSAHGIVNGGHSWPKLAGNDNEWRFMTGTSVSSAVVSAAAAAVWGFAPLKPAEFHVAGDYPSGCGSASAGTGY